MRVPSRLLQLYVHDLSWPGGGVLVHSTPEKLIAKCMCAIVSGSGVSVVSWLSSQAPGSSQAGLMAVYLCTC